MWIWLWWYSKHFLVILIFLFIILSKTLKHSLLFANTQNCTNFLPLLGWELLQLWNMQYSKASLELDWQLWDFKNGPLTVLSFDKICSLSYESLPLLLIVVYDNEFLFFSHISLAFFSQFILLGTLSSLCMCHLFWVYAVYSETGWPTWIWHSKLLGSCEAICWSKAGWVLN